MVLPGPGDPAETRVSWSEDRGELPVMAAGVTCAKPAPPPVLLSPQLPAKVQGREWAP